MAEFATVIKDGMIFDGMRSPRLRADIGIKDGRIAAIGRIDASDGDRVIDATGLHVAPGFIDLHTHYDAQVFWDPYCSLSGWHGVTSLSIGNCGFSFAPVAPEDRERAMLAMTRNEAIGLEAMQKGMPWDWVSIPEYLDSVERTPKSVNILPYVGIAPILTWVQGFEAAKAGAMPTDEEHAQMCQLLDEAMDAGAMGWSVQHLGDGPSNIQRDYDGTPMVTDVMNNETAYELAKVIARRREGIIETTWFTGDMMDDLAQVEKLAEISGQPILWNALYVDPHDDQAHRFFLNWIRRCHESGLPIQCQGITSEAPTLFTLEDWNLWDNIVEWREALMGTPAERLANLKARRDVLIQHPPHDIGTGRIEELELVETFTPEFKRFEGWKFGDIIRETGMDRIAAVLDIAIADELKTVFKADPLGGARAYWREVIDYPWVIPGQSDGGAHAKFITFGRYPTEYLTTWVRENQWLSLEEAHWRLSGYPAQVGGFKGRGVIREGAAADIVIYDYKNLEIQPHEVLADLPGGDWRRVQRAKGYRYVLVNGEVTIEDDRETGVASGQLLRWGGDPGTMHARALGAEE